MSVIATVTHHISTGELGNKRTASIAGTPGSELPSAYAAVNLDAKLAATDSGALYLALSNGYVRQTNMVNDLDGNPWYAALMVRTGNFSVYLPAGTRGMTSYVRGLPGYVSDWQWWNGAENYSFTGTTDFPARPDLTDESQASANGYFLLPFSLSDISQEVSEGHVVGTLWFCIPITWNAGGATTSANTIPATAVSIDVTTLVEYFPFAIRRDGAWASANRAGGSTTIRKEGSFRSVLNSEASGYDNKGFYRSGGAWVRAPRIGAE